MKIFQPFIIFLFFGFIISKASAQVYKFKSSSFSVVEKDDKKGWGKWSDFEENTLIITLDPTKNRIVIASQEIQLFKIIAYGKKIITRTDETIPLSCVDNDGKACDILIVTRKNQNNRKQLYVNYADFKYVYNITVIP
jgi:hypothetical protein